ncbi:MAG: bifunctional protein PaaZ/MaoC/YdbN [Polaromonas sp.]|nr:bifunctional protein PaaZ/MaoC/YdbN [Polaromonas sp.]
MTSTLQSYIGGGWQGAQAAVALRSAVSCKTIAHTRAERLDFAGTLEHARRKGLPALMAMDFQVLDQRLKALVKYLMEHKEQLYTSSPPTAPG